MHTLDSVGHMDSVATSPLCCCSKKAKEYVSNSVCCVPLKLYLKTNEWSYTMHQKNKVISDKFNKISVRLMQR